MFLFLNLNSDQYSLYSISATSSSSESIEVKAKFLDALSSAEEQVHKYQSKMKALNKNFSKVEVERKKFGDQFLYVEQELAAAIGPEHALHEQLLKEVNDS